MTQKWSNELRSQRATLLLTWLDPTAQGPEAGRFANRPVAEVALALALRLSIDTPSERMLLQVIREIQSEHPEVTLQLRSRGRPPRAEQFLRGAHMPVAAGE